MLQTYIESDKEPQEFSVLLGGRNGFLPLSWTQKCGSIPEI